MVVGATGRCRGWWKAAFGRYLGWQGMQRKGGRHGLPPAVQSPAAPTKW